MTLCGGEGCVCRVCAHMVPIFEVVELHADLRRGQAAQSEFTIINISDPSRRRRFRGRSVATNTSFCDAVACPEPKNGDAPMSIIRRKPHGSASRLRRDRVTRRTVCSAVIAICLPIVISPAALADPSPWYEQMNFPNQNFACSVQQEPVNWSEMSGNAETRCWVISNPDAAKRVDSITMVTRIQKQIVANGQWTTLKTCSKSDTNVWVLNIHCNYDGVVGDAVKCRFQTTGTVSNNNVTQSRVVARHRHLTDCPAQG